MIGKLTVEQQAVLGSQNATGLHGRVGCWVTSRDVQLQHRRILELKRETYAVLFYIYHLKETCSLLFVSVLRNIDFVITLASTYQWSLVMWLWVKMHKVLLRQMAFQVLTMALARFLIYNPDFKVCPMAFGPFSCPTVTMVVWFGSCRIKHPLSQNQNHLLPEYQNSYLYLWVQFRNVHCVEPHIQSLFGSIIHQILQ